MVKIITDKKGQIVTAFLVKLILAIMLLFASAAMVGEIFSLLLDQSGENFKDFTSDIKLVSERDSGYKLSSLLILDEEFAVVYYDNDKPVTLDIFYHNSGNKKIVEFPNTQSCEDGKKCICLFKNIDLTEYQENSNLYYALADSVECVELDASLEISSCSIGTPRGEASYLCNDGFVVERKVFDEISPQYLINDRRITFTIEKVEEITKIIPHDVYTYVEKEEIYVPLYDPGKI